MGAVRRQAARAGVRQDDAQRRAILTRTVELDVIPRLLAAHPGPIVPVSSVPGSIVPVPVGPIPVDVAAGLAEAGLPVTGPLAITPLQVTDLVALVLGRGETATMAFVEAVHDEGAAAEAIYLDLLAPAARALGEMWEADVCDITEVTIGLWRLHNTMRELGPTFARTADVTVLGPRALLVPLPGESHTFGLAMVHEFFRRAGWNAWTGPVASSADLRAMVRQDWVDVVGFSLACDERLDAVRTEIRAVRQASANPRIGIMVGGPCFTANPALALDVGADGTATDAHQAVQQAQFLVDRATADRGRTERATKRR